MSIAEIEKMSVSERLTTMEQLWDALCHEKDEPQSPDWHKPVLSQRKSRMSSAESRFYTVEQLRERFR